MSWRHDSFRQSSDRELRLSRFAPTEYQITPAETEKLLGGLLLQYAIGYRTEETQSSRIDRMPVVAAGFVLCYLLFLLHDRS
jgi:hypothetical protein